SFMNDLDRIFSPGYIPTYVGLLNTRLPSTGIRESMFNLDQLSYHVFDVGGNRSSRR
ncbi:hypothetical protein B0T14DRAFT_405998, partial [Immersiella caudata]